MVVELKYRNRYGALIETVKKIPDLKETEIEGYLRSTDRAICKMEIISTRKDKK